MPEFATRLSVAAVMLAALTGSAQAQNFPTKPIQLMVAFPAGGSTDIAARIVASIAEKELGQPIVVINRGGAGGQIGWTELVRQKPDGYYIGFINLPATNTVILDPDRRAIFTEKDFTPIILVEGRKDDTDRVYPHYLGLVENPMALVVPCGKTGCEDLMKRSS